MALIPVLDMLNHSATAEVLLMNINITVTVTS